MHTLAGRHVHKNHTHMLAGMHACAHAHMHRHKEPGTVDPWTGSVIESSLIAATAEASLQCMPLQDCQFVYTLSLKFTRPSM